MTARLAKRMRIWMSASRSEARKRPLPRKRRSQMLMKTRGNKNRLASDPVMLMKNKLLIFRTP